MENLDKFALVGRGESLKGVAHHGEGDHGLGQQAAVESEAVQQQHTPVLPQVLHRLRDSELLRHKPPQVLPGRLPPLLLRQQR